MSPTDSSIRIVWETPESSPAISIVKYGTTPDLKSTVRGPAGRRIKGEGYIHEVVITGLDPFTRYYYKVGDGDIFSDVCETKTAPSKGMSFRILSLGDIHNDSGGVWRKLCGKLIGERMDLTVFLGDFVNNGSRRDEWNDGFFVPGYPLLAKCPIISTIGNHETAFGSSTYYDYFSLPEHPANGDDPESYYGMNYGDVKIIAVNLNDDDYSPAFSSGSHQLAWLDNEIKNDDSKWIFIFSHVNVISTGFHGQWSDNQKKYIKPLLEKYSQKGKNIIFFAGDEHNFEHLYDKGVNYFRPGSANNIIRGRFNMSDSPFSVFFKATAGYSTIDLLKNGTKVRVAAHDITGKIFYDVEFTAGPKAFIKEQNRTGGIIY
ncbi:MAG: metallophosphoesterase family protein [Bacteroidales bacterium]|nr:metallophosphoesterase family protein [Bacteroidales bacterium]